MLVILLLKEKVSNNFPHTRAAYPRQATPIVYTLDIHMGVTKHDAMGEEKDKKIPSVGKFTLVNLGQNFPHDK